MVRTIIVKYRLKYTALEANGKQKTRGRIANRAFYRIDTHTRDRLMRKGMGVLFYEPVAYLNYPSGTGSDVRVMRNEDNGLPF